MKHLILNSYSPKLPPIKEYKKKRSFTLVEILVSFVLISALFSFLLSNFSSYLKLSNKTEKIQALAYQRFYFHKRLSDLLRDNHPPSDEFYHDSETQSLNFSISNLIDPDPKFTKNLDCEIKLLDGSLILSISPKQSTQKREEILFENVAAISYLFERNLILPKDSLTFKKEPAQIPFWKKEYQSLPLSFKMIITFRSGQNLEYFFSLSSAIKTIYYES